jgi:ribosome-associated protein
MYQPLRLAKKVAVLLDFSKGDDVKLYDISAKSCLASYAIICSAESQRKVEGLAEEAENCICENGGSLGHIEGEREHAPWVLLDGHDILIHIMSEKERARLRFDDLFKDCKEISYLASSKKGRKKS